MLLRGNAVGNVGNTSIRPTLCNLQVGFHFILNRTYEVQRWWEMVSKTQVPVQTCTSCSALYMNQDRDVE